MRALVYLELRYAAHQAAAVLRSPARLALWLLYAASIAFFAHARMIPRHANAYTGFTLTPAHATGIGSAYIALLLVAIALAAGGRVTVFRTSSEAIFFSNAGVRPLTIVVWLQLRKVAAGWTRVFGGILYVFLLFAPHHGNVADTLRALCATLLALALQYTVELPAFLLSRGPLNVAIRAAAWVAVACALILALLAFFAEGSLALVLRFVPVDPGPAASAVFAGSPSALALLAALLAALVASIAVRGSDALPEVYGASLQTFVRRGRARTSSVHFALPRGTKAARIPAGSLTLVWKDWIGFRRGRGALALWLTGCGLWMLCGAGVAFVAMRSGDPAPLFWLGALTVIMLFALTPLGAAAGLAADLAKPIFWLSCAPLRARIAAWTFGRTWRGAIALGLAPSAAGVVSGNTTLALAALPLTFATYWSLQALGVGLYALFPSTIDARGPLALIRALATFASVLPPIALASVAMALQVTIFGACFGATLAFIVEGTLALELASHRFYQRGATLGTLSRAV